MELSIIYECKYIAKVHQGETYIPEQRLPPGFSRNGVAFFSIDLR